MEQTHRNTNGRDSNGRYDNQPEFEVQEFVSKDGRWCVRKVIWTTFKATAEVTAMLDRAKKAVGASAQALSTASTTA